MKPRRGLSEAIRELAVGGQTPLPGKLHVTPLEAAGHAGRPLLWVLGLDEARFPGAPRQDPVLLDHERKRLGEILGVKLALRGADAGSKARHALLSALARTRGEIVLSFSERDLLEDADRFPSAFLLEAFRAKTSRLEADYAALLEEIGPAEGFVPEPMRRSTTENGGSRRSPGIRSQARILPTCTASIPVSARPLARRRRGPARGSRSGTAVSRRRRASSIPRGGELVVSASRLERLAACPRAYFFKDVLKLSVPEEERPAGVWLQPYEFGNLLHELFHDFLGVLTATR